MELWRCWRSNEDHKNGETQGPHYTHTQLAEIRLPQSTWLTGVWLKERERKGVRWPSARKDQTGTHSISSNTRQAVRCAFGNMFLQELLHGYRGLRTLQAHRLRQSDSTERLCHRRWKHRWNRSMDCSGAATTDITSIWIMDWLMNFHELIGSVQRREQR